MLRQSGPYSTDESLQQASKNARHARYHRDITTLQQGWASRRWLSMLMTLLLSCLPLFSAYANPTSQAEDSTDPYLRKGIRLDISALNYTSRNVGEYSLDGIWASNVSAARAVGKPSGFGSTICCFNLTDYTKPVKVRWKWEGVLSKRVNVGNGITLPGKLLVPEIQKEALVMLPQRWPLVVQSDDPRERLKSEDTLCVIFLDMDTVELRYSSGTCSTR